MAEFDESKHPRAEDGKFTNGGAREFRQNTSHEDILRSSIVPGKAYGFANKERKNARDHINHAKEMGFKNQDEYERAAIEFWNHGDGIIYKGVRRSDFSKYNPKTKRFVVVNANGDIKTFYEVSQKKFARILKQEGYEKWKK